MRFFPHDLPTCNGRVVFLKVAEDEASILKCVGTNLARADVAGIGGHFRHVNNLLLLHIDLVSPTISEGAVGGSKLFLRCRMHRISPFWTFWIHQVSTHVTIALVHEETLTLCAIQGVWPTGAIFHSLLGGDQLPRAHDLISYVRFGLPKDGRSAEHDR